MSEVAFDVLPPLTSGEAANITQAIERRRLNAVQRCVFCGDRAAFTYVAHEMDPLRWMDVCFPHSRYLRGMGPL